MPAWPNSCARACHGPATCRWDPAKLTAVVIGCGLSGALASHYLAMRGYRVMVRGDTARPTSNSYSSRRYLRPPLQEFGQRLATSRPVLAWSQVFDKGPRPTPEDAASSPLLLTSR